MYIQEDGRTERKILEVCNMTQLQFLIRDEDIPSKNRKGKVVRKNTKTVFFFTKFNFNRFCLDF